MTVVDLFLNFDYKYYKGNDTFILKFKDHIFMLVHNKDESYIQAYGKLDYMIETKDRLRLKHITHLGEKL